MTWSDIPFRPQPKALRQFALGCLVILPGLGALQYCLRGHHAAGLAFAIVGAALGLLGLIQPRLLQPVFVGWMVVAFPIGWLVSQCMMLLMFYVILTPVALLLRLQNRDQLGLKPGADTESYWVPADKPKDAGSYFRQY